MVNRTSQGSNCNTVRSEGLSHIAPLLDGFPSAVLKAQKVLFKFSAQRGTQRPSQVQLIG